MLLLPLAGMLLLQPEQYSPSDGRALKVLPAVPSDLNQWGEYPAALKDYSNCSSVVVLQYQSEYNIICSSAVQATKKYSMPTRSITAPRP